MSQKYGTIVVIGGSIGGALAAAAAAPWAERVLVLDRDRLPEQPAVRPSVPQGAHTHGLLAGGRAAMEELLPGFTAAAVARGGIAGTDPGDAAAWYVGGGRLAPCELDSTGLAGSRPLIEHSLRERLRLLPQVGLLEGVDVVRLLGSPQQVTGVVARRRDGGEECPVQADLVVDASGRAARAARWLPEIGVPAPAEERVRVGVRYATVHVKAEDADVDGRVAVISAATPEAPQAGVAVRQEDATWTVTVAGYGDQLQPRDPDGVRSAAARVVAPEISALLQREFLHDALSYRFPDARRRRFERISLPDGYAPIGDAICSFDPTFGQGMSVAAQEALALRDLLGHGPGAVRRDYPRCAARVIDSAWLPMLGEVLQLPGTQGTTPRGHTAVSAYLRRLKRAARHDAELAGAFLRVINLLEGPQTLFAPQVAVRVIRG